MIIMNEEMDILFKIIFSIIVYIKNPFPIR